MKDFSLGIYLGFCSGEVRMHLRMKVEAIGLGLGNKAVGPSCEIENADREPLQHRIITSYPCRSESLLKLLQKPRQLQHPPSTHS